MNRLEKAAIVSSIGNALIAVLKFVIGTLFGSIALIADAIHSFTDIISSIAVFFGIKFSEKKSKSFPYGLYKLENFASLFVALIIFWGGISILLESIAKFSESAAIISVIPIIVAIISLIFIVFLTRYKQRVGREENSPGMLADAKHSQLDIYGTIGVLIAVSLSFAGYPIFDPIIGIFIGLLVFKAGIGIFIDSAKVLLDVSLDYKSMKKIEKIVLESDVLKIKELVARNSGRYVFVDLKLETKLRDLKKVDRLHKQLEEKIKSELPRIDKIMLDIECQKKPVLKYAVALKSRGEKAELTEEFGTAKFFGLIVVSNDEKQKILNYEIIPNPHYAEEHRKGILAAELLVKNKVDMVFSLKELHKGGSFYALKENAIGIEIVKEKTFEEILKKFKSKVN